MTISLVARETTMSLNHSSKFANVNVLEDNDKVDMCYNDFEP